MASLSSIFWQYLVQSTFHAFLIALVVEALLRIWRVERPQSRGRFRLLTLALPVLLFPLYQLAVPERGSESFRRGMALIDLEDWLALEVAGRIPLGYILALFMVLAAALFIAQEVVPASRQWWRRWEPLTPMQPEEFPLVEQALSRIAYAARRLPPPVFLLNREEPIAYVAGIAPPVLVLSPSLIRLLDAEELEGVLAHEMSHLLLRDNLASWGLLLLRGLLLHNLVALVSFRSLVQEQEKVCDDQAVALTQNPIALASGLVKVFRGVQVPPPPVAREKQGLLSWTEALDRRARRAHLEERLVRLLHTASPDPTPNEGLRWGLLTASMVALLYFVV